MPKRREVVDVNVPVVPDTAPVEATEDGVIAPSVSVIAGVVVADATEPETPLAVVTETLVTVPDPEPPEALTVTVPVPLAGLIVTLVPATMRFTPASRAASRSSVNSAFVSVLALSATRAHSANERIRAMRVHHVLDRIRDDLARGERVEHPVMPKHQAAAVVTHQRVGAEALSPVQLLDLFVRRKTIPARFALATATDRRHRRPAVGGRRHRCAVGAAEPARGQVQHREVAVPPVDAGAAQFQHLRTHGLEGREVELAFAVVAEVLRGARAEVDFLQHIRAGDTQFQFVGKTGPGARVWLKQSVIPQQDPFTVGGAKQAVRCRAPPRVAGERPLPPVEPPPPPDPAPDTLWTVPRTDLPPMTHRIPPI